MDKGPKAGPKGCTGIEINRQEATNVNNPQPEVGGKGWEMRTVTEKLCREGPRQGLRPGSGMEPPSREGDAYPAITPHHLPVPPIGGS